MIQMRLTKHTALDHLFQILNQEFPGAPGSFFQIFQLNVSLAADCIAVLAETFDSGQSFLPGKAEK